MSGRFLAKLGARVATNGYLVVPIEPGAKRPPLAMQGWQNLRATPETVRGWIGNGQAEAGVGILAAETPGIDVDVTEEAAAAHMQRWCEENIASAPVRYGAWPKRLMMFRATAPFRKITSRRYVDPSDPTGKRTFRVEVLGEGQQWVAHHIHPDTGQPYRWEGDRGPHNTAREELPELTEADARRAVAEFERYAEARGWRRHRRAEDVARGTALTTRRDAAADDDWTRGLEDNPLGWPLDKLKAKLALIPAFEGYEDWLGIGAAVHHETRGGAEGLELFHDYSSRCSNYDAAECDEKWASFLRSGEAGAKTAKWIQKLASVAERQAATEGRQAVEDAMRSALTLEELVEAANLAKRQPFDAPTRGLIAGLLREQWRIVTGQALTPRDARAMVRLEDPERERTPPWLHGWVYCTVDSAFYRRSDGETMTKQAFNDAHARRMLTRRDVLEGRAYPEVPPAEAALNIHQIPVVRSRLYMPGEDGLFALNGVPYVNTYSARTVPEARPSKAWTAEEREDVEIVSRHFDHLLADPRERWIVLSFFAFVVQTLKRPNFALLLQGLEGDGKTVFYYLMCAVLGAENVKSIDAGLLKRDFTSWGEGSLFAFIEELRLLSENRYEILNRLKPFISNAVVSIHHKGRGEYLAPNTQAYVGLTNYRDALPIGQGDSRYFVAWSRWQDPAAFRAWKAENPDYYKRLYRAIERSPGALRAWMLGVELHPEFDPNGRAPASSSKQRMLATMKTDDSQAVEDAIADSKRADLSEDLLNATVLAEAMAEAGATVPQTQTMHRLLADLGFTLIGRVRIKGRYQRFWSKRPGDFTTKGGHIDREAVRAWIDGGGL